MKHDASFSADSLRQVLLDQLAVEANSAVYVAFSGGLDSHVLLHALSSLAADYPFIVEAIHVNHSLQEQSAAWAAHCQQVCDGLSVPLTIRTLSIDQKKGESLEAAARDARYAALAECLPEDGLCMTAQHRNDQTETLLLQLLRGAGVHGLAAMPESKSFSTGRLLRPLLGFSRQDLLDYAITHKLVWIEDPSNQNNRFDRNYLRKEVLPVLRQRWPGLDKSISRSVRHAASAAALLDEVARSDLNSCAVASNHFFPPCIACLDANSLASLSSIHRINALRYWVRINGLSVPGDERMQSLDQFLEQPSVHGSVIWPDGALRLDNGTLWLCENTANDKVVDSDLLDWTLPAPLQLQNIELLAIPVRGEGLSLSLLNGAALQVGFRQGGELCQMSGDHGKKPLKNLFQDLSIPTWMRDSIPLVFLENDLVAVSSFWYNPHFLPDPDEEGYVFSICAIEATKQ